MAEGNSTSFIPKNANRVRKPRTNKRIYIFSYISYVFFFGTLLSVIGVYVYGAYVDGALEEQEARLTAERDSFNEADIAEVRDLEVRLRIADQLLETTSAPSRIFDSLESVIVDSVYLSGMTYTRSGDGNFTLTFSGATETFDAALFQRELLKNVPLFAATDVAQFTYGTPSEDDGSSSEQNENIDEQLVVKFRTSGATSLFAYEAPETVTDAPEAQTSTSSPEVTDEEEVSAETETTATSTSTNGGSQTTGTTTAANEDS